MNEVLELLKSLVAIPSVTLAKGESAPSPQHGEGRVAAFVAEWLRARGLPCDLEEIEPGRPQVTSTVGRGRREILLTSHTDTVPAVAWENDPWRPRLIDGRLHGLGACDDKASLAAMMVAFAELAESGAEAGRITLVAMVGEEMFGVGSTHYVGSGYRPDAAIVGEPTELRAVRAQCGNVRWRVHARGRAAHGSRPWDGDNALYRIAHVLRTVSEEVAPEVSSHSHPLVGRAAMNAGMLEGGSAFNIVPDRATLSLEMRILPGQDPLIEWLRVNDRIAAAAEPEFLTIEDPVACNHPVDTPAGHPLMRAFAAVLSGRGMNPKPAGVTYGSDANRLAAVDIPCILFGPGNIAQAHTRDEFVDVHEVVQAAEIYRDVVRAYLSQPV